MQTNTQDIISLIGEKYIELQRACEEQWSQQGHMRVTPSEWYLLDAIDGALSPPSLSQVAKAMGISRQATHKGVASLQEKGLVESVLLPNKRDRYVQLSPLGQECFQAYSQMRGVLEDQIATAIGEPSAKKLKLVLTKKWL